MGDLVRARRGRPAEDLSLIPVMNLVSILVPFLLLGAQFAHLAVAPAALPNTGEAAEQEEDAVPVRLTLRIGLDGLVVAAAPETSEGRVVALPCRDGRCATLDEFDWNGLTRTLAEFKDTWPKERSILLIADERLPFEVLVRAMDASREDRRSVAADGGPRPLFPDAVLGGAE